MVLGTPIARTWVCMLNDGTPVIDWGEGTAQDIYSGDFMEFSERLFSHCITDRELDQLIHAGRVAGYDSQTVFMNALPELPRRLLE